MNHCQRRTHRRPVLLATALGLALSLSTLGAQSTSECALVVLDQDGMRVLDTSGTQLSFAPSNGFPAVQLSPIGPRMVMTDQNGSQLYERFGSALGPIVPKVGGLQRVMIHTDRVFVIGDNDVTITDLNRIPIGSPIAKSGNRRQIVKANAARIVVVDSSQVRIFDRQGVRVGPSISTGGIYPSWVLVTPDRILVTHDNGTIVMDNNGVRLGSTIGKQGNNWQTVKAHGGRFIITDDQTTQVFDNNRQLKGTIQNSSGRRQFVKASGDRITIIDDLGATVTDLDGAIVGTNVFNSGLYRQTVEVATNRIIITDDNETQIYDQASMNRLATLPKSLQDRQDVVADGNSIIITGQGDTQILDQNGSLQGTTIPNTGNSTQVARIDGDRILVIDTDQTRVFDRMGQLIRSIATPGIPEYDVLLFANLIAITFSSQVSLYNRDGVLQGQPIRYSLGVQHVQVLEDRAIIVDGNRFMLYDLQANQIGNTLITRGDPEVYALCWDVGSFTNLGSGCSGSMGMPTVTRYGNPYISGFMGFALQNAPANTPVSMNLGFSTTIWNGVPLPLDLSPFGAPGCLMHTDAAIVLSAMTNSNGSGLVAFFVPPTPILVGLVAHGQYLIPDPSANTLGLTVSNGLTVRIGEGY